MKTYGILCFVLALFMILTPLLSLDYSSFSLSNVKSTFQKENDREDEEKKKKKKSDSVKIKSAAARAGKLKIRSFKLPAFFLQRLCTLKA